MKDYRHFVTIAILLLFVLAIGIGSSINKIPEAGQIIVAALAGIGLLIKAWIDKTRGKEPYRWLSELKAFIDAWINRDRKDAPSGEAGRLSSGSRRERNE